MAIHCFMDENYYFIIKGSKNFHLIAFQLFKQSVIDEICVWQLCEIHSAFFYALTFEL